MKSKCFVFRGVGRGLLYLGGWADGGKGIPQHVEKFHRRRYRRVNQQLLRVRGGVANRPRTT